MMATSFIFAFIIVAIAVLIVFFNKGKSSGNKSVENSTMDSKNEEISVAKNTVNTTTYSTDVDSAYPLPKARPNNPFAEELKRAIEEREEAEKAEAEWQRKLKEENQRRERERQRLRQDELRRREERQQSDADVVHHTSMIASAPIYEPSPSYESKSKSSDSYSSSSDSYSSSSSSSDSGSSSSSSSSGGDW